MSWYEDGKDRAMGTVGRGYGRAAYARALAYIAQSAKKYGIFTSLVMPHLNNDAEVEARYGNMVRIVADTGDGGWRHTSAHDKGRSYMSWPNCMNQFDGFNYWAHITGRNKVILDGDFLRMNKYDTDAERQTAVTLQLMAGGPVAVADQPQTIADNLKFYTNSELLALRQDGFVGQPLNSQLGQQQRSVVWYALRRSVCGGTVQPQRPAADSERGATAVGYHWRAHRARPLDPYRRRFGEHAEGDTACPRLQDCETE